MFTGLIQAVGEVAESRPAGVGRRLVIDAGSWDHTPSPGESISVSGCCLTIAEPVRAGRLAFDVVGETLARTTIGSWTPGTGVNLEHAARADSLLGGHIVQGHIDGVGIIEQIRTDPLGRRVRIRTPRDLMPLIPPKGSIAVAGVSLTVASVSAGWFEAALIPTTLERTTLGSLDVGAQVDLETDILARTVAHWLGVCGAGG